MTSLAQNLTDSAERFPDRPALRLHDTTLTYAELGDLVGRAAGRMAELGVTAGDRVGLMLPNVLEFPVLFYGALRLGAIVVPMNPLLKGREIAHYAGDSGMSLLWAHDSVAEQDLAQAPEGVSVERVDASTLSGLADTPVGDAVDASDPDTAVILYTSGTTGAPKGAELTHGGLNRNLRVCIEDLMDIDENDVIMGCLPLFHVFGLTCALNAAVAAGALLVLIPRFDPQVVLSSIEQNGATIFEGVPTMYTALAGLPGVGPEAVATLRLCSSGVRRCRPRWCAAFEAAYGSKDPGGLRPVRDLAGGQFNRAGPAQARLDRDADPGRASCGLVDVDGKRRRRRARSARSRSAATT